MQQSELVAISNRFRQGVGKLQRLGECLQALADEVGFTIESLEVDTLHGELVFVFAGMKFYVRVRVTDREVDDVGIEYRVPVGWLDWGRFDGNGHRDAPIHSNFFDDRGILCELEKETFYCDLSDCNDERVQRGVYLRFSALVSRAIALNNAV